MIENVLVAGMAATEAAAQHPQGLSAIPAITYVWVFLISLLGGIASFYRKMRDGHARPFNVNEFVGECCIAGFVGLVTFFACKWAEINEYGSAALIGITSHMGARGIFLVEQFVGRWVASRAPVPAQPFPEPPKEGAL